VVRVGGGDVREAWRRARLPDTSFYFAGFNFMVCEWLDELLQPRHVVVVTDTFDMNVEVVA
jgi:hypothetical protein